MDLPVAASVLILVVGILTLLAAIFAVIGIALRQQTRRTASEWTAQGMVFRRGPESANYRGHASSAVPVKGNGVLGLGEAVSRFVQLVPRREFVISLSQITGVSMERGWKVSIRAGSPVLVVHYRTESGEDAIGLMVRQPQAWQSALLKAAHLPAQEQA